MELLTIDDLSRILRIHRRTLQNRLSVAPDTLPPPLRLPGTAGPRWRPQDVQAWIDQHAAAATPRTAAPAQPARRRGRPKKAVALAPRPEPF